MPLIKYYTPQACYDGRKGFSQSNPTNNPAGRFYPDEYLIAQILQNYLSLKLNNVAIGDRKIIVLTEPWSGTSTSRNPDNKALDDGGHNTVGINTLIFQQIESSSNDNTHTLLLVPFLYGYHHPGMTIDVKNKKAIYLDPYGGLAKYPEAQTLAKQLQDTGFTVEAVATKQQYDGVSCGPILTASMMKFIDEFLSDGKISISGFTANRSDLATIRIQQMLVNNNGALNQQNMLIDEIMLADEQLWRGFFNENNVDNSFINSLVVIIKKQQHFINSLDEQWENTALEKIISIRSFQTAIAQLVFAKDAQFSDKFNLLLDLSQHIFNSEKETNVEQATNEKGFGPSGEIDPIEPEHNEQPHSNEQPSSNTGDVIGVIAGGFVTAYYGTQLGMALGSAMLPGIGTVAGGIVGGCSGWIIGAIGGALLGIAIESACNVLGSLISEWITPKHGTDNEQDSSNSLRQLIENTSDIPTDGQSTEDQIHYPTLFKDHPQEIGSGVIINESEHPQP